MKILGCVFFSSNLSTLMWRKGYPVSRWRENIYKKNYIEKKKQNGSESQMMDCYWDIASNSLSGPLNQLCSLLYGDIYQIFEEEISSYR
jgi:hypothetical protein